MNLTDVLKKYPPFEEAVLKLNKTPMSICGVTESAQGQLIASLRKSADASALVITYSDMEAQDIKNNLELYFDDVLYFPSKDYIFYNIETIDRSRINERLLSISKLTEEKGQIIVASIDAIMQYTIDRETFLNNVTELRTGKRYDIKELSQKLVNIGYVKEDMVEGKGQFSVRGEIMDIYSPNLTTPVRLDFFDDELETIKTFDVLSQRSLGEVDGARIVPVTEALFDAEKKEEIIKELEEILDSANSEEERNIIETDIDNFKERNYFPSIDKFVQRIYRKIPSVLDYMESNDLVFFIDTKRVFERVSTEELQRASLITELKEKGVVYKNTDSFYLSEDEVKEKAKGCRVISLEELNHTNKVFKFKSRISFSSKTTVSFHGKLDYLCEDLKRYRENGTTVVILAANRGRGENLEGVLKERGFDVSYIHTNRDFKEGQMVIMRGNLNKGFLYPELNFVLICDNEILTLSRTRRRKKVKDANKIKSYTDISIGDYVVHQTHGIGQYVGIKKMSMGTVTKDYLKIQYRGTDALYVPIDQLDMLYKYVGNTDKELRLNKLGTQEWNRTKQKVKESTLEMAKQLIELYSQRSSIKGHQYSKDTVWQRDFEDGFDYEETDDQLRSIEEVKADMESDKPMDRLLLGDVGFGKTEVALRAAFKAVSDSKQVAYFCPTTILAMQHYETFLKRMENFPIKVEMLSRFRTPAAVKRILKQLKNGEIDIVVGTHKLLSKDVSFKDLGLLIVDEEQRFGVAHKERLKEIKKNVDVLTMSATPIPRTLHMAMTSVRDMSVLEEPPSNRYPVQTYVLEENETVLNDAIRNELSRGGQVFYLYNHVSGIYNKANKIQEQFKNARVRVGHGKMREEELEDIMCDMAEGKIDVLVCTTIIETGLDIPNANTIIIEEADRMGLAQLYQLRGRVGRSNRAAYAYFTYKRDKNLTETATKRLQAIKEFTEFGSGFKIAMRDLEIRGAGNILGAEQHGHMDTVGYDMYCKLLKESINEAQNIKTTDDMVVTVDVELDAYLPDSYIKNHNQRIDMYKRIAAIECDEDRFEIEDELEDRYGKIPKTARNIIEIASLKPLSRSVGISEITQRGKMIELKFVEGELDATLVWDIDGAFPKRIKVASSNQPTIHFRLLDTDKDIIVLIKDILNTIYSLKNGEK